MQPHRGSQKMSRPAKQELKVVKGCELADIVLGTELRSSSRAQSVLLISEPSILTSSLCL